MFRSAPPRGLGALQAQIEFALPGGQALPGCGFQQLQLELVMGRAKVLESRDPRRDEWTICTAVAPEVVFTVRRCGDTSPA